MPTAAPQQDEGEEEQDMEDDGEANESADIYEEIDNEDNEQDQDTSKGEGKQITSDSFRPYSFSVLVQTM